jgi:hypothetical protein
MKKKNISLERSDLAVLVLHLNAMRNSVKKGFKRNYGLFEGKQKIKIYDAMKESFSGTFERDEVNGTELDHEQLDMLHSFIKWYIPELSLDADDEGIKWESNESAQALERVKEQVYKKMFEGEMDRVIY